MFWTIFLAVFLALIANDRRRGLHTMLVKFKEEEENRASEHNREMNLSHDRGDQEMAKMHAKYYTEYVKSAKRWGMWDWLLP